MKRFNICGAAPIEPLESRRLLAAIVDRVRTIDGSAAVDPVTLRHGSTASSLLVRHNVLEQTYGQSSFDFIRISGGPGNDRVIVEYNGRSVPLWFLAARRRPANEPVVRGAGPFLWRRRERLL